MGRRKDQNNNKETCLVNYVFFWYLFTLMLGDAVSCGENPLNDCMGTQVWYMLCMKLMYCWPVWSLKYVILNNKCDFYGVLVLYL